ncbi:SDR family oxidoreductase [Pyxidicoccus caerfyrddinensis]|uniref:SDR family oxidoreductase n=1 Tax=Pyxidicoccus caerfyrddinensis TaxID=2709663 RepID=UPI0013DD2152
MERLVLLVRAQNLDQARQRARQSLERFDSDRSVLQRLDVICGDLAHCDLLEEVRTQLTHVVHAAAHTSFLSVRTSRETNVEGTRALAEVVTSAPRLERFLFIGTAYRCGVVEASVLGEDVPPSDSHVAEYTRTKADAEAVLENIRDLPLIVARPSIIIGHTTLGVVPSASLYWYYWALARAGVSPFVPTRRRDIVPVDWVAAAIIHLLFLPQPHFRRYHLSAGEGSAVSWASIHETFARFGEALPTTEHLDLGALADHPAWARLEFESRAKMAVMACAKFSAVPVGAFSNQRILGEGVAAPPPFTSYLPRCIQTNRRSLNQLALDDA